MPRCRVHWLFLLGLLLLAQVVAAQQQQQEGSNNGNSNKANDDKDKDACPLLMLLPFSESTEPPVNKNDATTQRPPLLPGGWTRASYSYLAAMRLAMEHFNQRNTVLVPDLVNSTTLPQPTAPPLMCPVYFPLPADNDTDKDAHDYLVYNTGWDVEDGVKALLQAEMVLLRQKQQRQRQAALLLVQPSENANSTDNNNNTSCEVLVPLEDPRLTIPPQRTFPCAVVGPYNDKGNILLSGMTQTLGLPQLSFIADSQLILAQGDQTPSILGMVQSMPSRAERLLDYLQQKQVRPVDAAAAGSSDDTTRQYFITGVHDSKPDNVWMARMVMREATERGSRISRGGEDDEESDHPHEFVASVFAVGSGLDMRQGLANVRTTGVRTVLLYLKNLKDLGEAATILDEWGMLHDPKNPNNAQHQDADDDDQYLYILPSWAPPDQLAAVLGAQPVGSPLDRLLRGSLIVDRMDPWQAAPVAVTEPDEVVQNSDNNNTDPFWQVWTSLDAAFVQRVNRMVPARPAAASTGGGPPRSLQGDSNGNVQFPWIQAPDDFFQTYAPSQFTSYLYDTVMAIGLGACRQWREAQQKSTQNNNMPPKGGGRPPNGGPPSGGADTAKGPRGLSSSSPPATTSGSSLPTTAPAPAPATKKKKKSKIHPFNQAIIKTAFQGASGYVDFVQDGSIRSRKGENIYVGAYNIRSSKTMTTSGDDEATPPLQTYDLVLTSLWKPEVGHWQDVRPFVYSNGSTRPPSRAFVVAETHYLKTWVRALGFSLLAVAWLASFVAMFLVWYLGKEQIIQMSQPFFLHLVCVGAIIMATAIFTLSFDEGSGWMDTAMDRACIATPWFFFVGHVTVFSALFTKLWRLDKVLQFRRGNKVTIRDVMGPIAALSLITLALLVAWTVTDPWTWNRELIADFPPESYGRCDSDNVAHFFGPLMAVILVAEVLTVYFAWKTADVPEDYRDANQVLLAIGGQIQAWSVGVPILAVLGDSSANAMYLGRVFVVWIFAVSSVAIVVYPKIVAAYRLRLNPDRNKQSSRVRISGLTSGPNVRISGLSSPSALPAPDPSPSSPQKNPPSRETERDASTTSHSAPDIIVEVPPLADATEEVPPLAGATEEVP